MANIRKRSNKYQARVQRTGISEQIRTFSSRQDAERWARAVERDIDLGVYLAETHKAAVTVAQLLSRYRTEVSPTKRGGDMEVIRLQAMERRKIGPLDATKLTAKAVAQYRDDRLKDVSGATVNRDLDDLSTVLNHARREWGHKITNPVRDVRRPPRGRSRSRVLCEVEEAKLMAVLDDDGRDLGGRFVEATRNPWIRPLVQLALLTAMRRGELLSLDWPNVDLDKRIARLPITKNGDERTVPLSTRAVEVLQRVPKEEGRQAVFPTTAMALRKAFERACKRAGLKDLHFHDLRHTAATRLSQRLPNLIELAAVTGHRDLRMLQRYYHPRAQDLAKKLG